MTKNNIWFLAAAGAHVLFFAGCGELVADAPKAGDSTGDGSETDSPGGTDSDVDQSPSDSEIRETVLANPDEDDAAPLFNRDEITEVRLFLPADDWEALKVNARDEQYIAADVVINDQILDDIGLRFKGAYGTLHPCFDENDTLICPKLSMKLKFNEYEEDQRFMGLKKLNLHSGESDDTMVRDCMGYDMFRDAGIVSPRCSYAFIYVNDEINGLYIMIEQVDGRFTDSRFRQGDGNLYKEAWPVSKNDWYFAEHLKTNEETAVHTAFKQFSVEMQDANDDTLSATLAGWVHLDYWLRYMAVDYAVANWDGITTFYCGIDWPCLNHNYYIYQEEQTDRFWIIPWDVTATFSLDHWLGDIEPWDKLDADCVTADFVDDNDWYIRAASCDDTNRAIALTDHKRYAVAVQQVLDELFTVDGLNRRTDALVEFIEPWMAADPDRNMDDWKAAVESLRAQFPALRTRLAAAL